MKKFKKLFKNKNKDDRNDLVVTKDRSINTDELASYIRNLEAENRDLKDTTTENNTISYKLGKTIIDTLNKQSSTTELPSKLLKIYAESRKRKLPNLKSASLVDKALILLSDKELLNNYRLSDAKPKKKIEYKKNSRIHRVIKPENETNTIYEQNNIENTVFKKNIPTSNSVVNRKNYIDIDNKDAPFGSIKHSETVELSKKNPIWYELPVQAGQVLTIKAASNYLNTKTTDRKAILLLKSYDSNGNEIHEPCGKLSYSSHLKGYFKYLHSTNNKVQDLHTFTVPDGVSKIYIELCAFNITKDEQVFVSNFSIEPKINESQIEKKLSFGSFKQQDTIELPQKDPVWYEVPVQAGQILVIKAASQYKNTGNITNRKAILLIKSYDSNGNRIDVPCGKMAKSKQLNAYFKYLPCTNNLIQELHTFIVPNDVSQIHIGLSGFNIFEQEQVFVKNFSIEPKIDKSQTTKFVTPSAQAADISILGWPDIPINNKPSIIGIMDEFTTGCFEQDVNLIQPRPDNWFALAEKYKPALFFIESAWKGNYGSWQYRVGQYANKPGHEIEQICQYARDKGIPTLFWNKEDPVHHEKFMCSAKLVDYIYTTDANMKDSYITKTGNTNVHALPFAAQPALHKPASLLGRKPRSCFAGSWYGNRHAERGEAMGWLLQAANNYGLDIYDRNYGTGTFPFPEEYRAGIKGSLPYKDLCKEYSRYRVFLNVNSVTESPTMFSRRVFELMASGTPVVSTYAKGIEALFDSDAVWLVNSQEEADNAICTLMTDDVEWRRRSLAGIREIFSKHTYAHRLNGIFKDMNIESRIPTDPNVMLFSKANSLAEIDMLKQFANKQSYQEFRLVIEYTQSKSFIVTDLPENVVVIELGEKEAWAAKNKNDYSIAGWLKPDSYYGEYYLRDLVNASIYEPNAKGWAKALEQDIFDYGAQAMICGTIWKTVEFFNYYLNADPDSYIIEPNLYIADSDEFQSRNL